MPHPTKRPWRSAIAAAFLAWVATFVASFACGLIIEAADKLGGDQPTQFLAAGLFFGIMGALIFGVPISLLTGLLNWRGGRKRLTTS